MIGGVKTFNIKLSAISESHAQIVAQDFYDKNGLIGRFYVETSTGFQFSINN